MDPNADPSPGFGIYIHWPFCTAKCPYCDFNSHVVRSLDQDAWRDALVRDLTRQLARTDQETVTSVFFGGGTPSLMPAETVSAILETVARTCRVSDTLEVTLEANPTSVERDKFQAFRSAGVNRVSLGVQALNDEDLKALGRLHSAEEALAALETAMSTFDRVSFDLIYARQNQTMADWTAELDRALTFAADHLSLYQLTIEPNTRFGDLYERNALRGLPSAGLSGDLYDATVDICRAQGFDLYEISNFCRAGAASRHNLTYWRYGPYLGVGPGAHGRRPENGVRTSTVASRMPAEWLGDAGTDSVETAEPLSTHEQGLEYAMMSLRLTEGLSLSRFRDISGLEPPTATDLIAAGMVTQDGDRLRVTDAGRLVLNRVTAEWLNPIL